MGSKKTGNQTVVFENGPYIIAGHSIVGPKEGQGPLAPSFDTILPDTYDGENSWEKTETKMMENTMRGVINKADIPLDTVDYILAGDLLNQLISSNFSARQLGLPFIGLYGACSTMALSMAIGSMLIDGGYGSRVICSASSHHETAERQYRLPTEQGNQRAMYAQWTVTGAGSLLLDGNGSGPRITTATIGRIIDYEETDVNNMGAAMTPAVADTIINHLNDLKRQPDYYDLIVTGDLGTVGLQLLLKVLEKNNVKVGGNFNDCGVMIYSAHQDTHAGGSGCGCSAAVMAGHILKRIFNGKLKKVLFVGSGSLHSPTSSLQGESIPAIGHAVSIEV